MIKLKRAYDRVGAADGTRFLVERLWPRGVKTTDLHAHAWLKDVAPYFRELSASADLLEPILKAARHGRVTRVQLA